MQGRLPRLRREGFWQVRPTLRPGRARSKESARVDVSEMLNEMMVPTLTAEAAGKRRPVRNRPRDRAREVTSGGVVSGVAVGVVGCCDPAGGPGGCGRSTTAATTRAFAAAPWVKATTAF